MTPIPTLETERLILRPPALDDYPVVRDFYASDRSKMVGGPINPRRAWLALASAIGHWSLRGFGRWVLDAKDGETALGLVGLHHPEGWPEPEIAWTLWRDDAEGKGYAFEAAQAARAHAYDTLGWTTAVSLIDPENSRSVALGERMGVRFESVFEHPDYGPLNVWRHPSPEELS